MNECLCAAPKVIEQPGVRQFPRFTCLIHFFPINNISSSTQPLFA